jgi:hypothetical protein
MEGSMLEGAAETVGTPDGNVDGDEGGILLGSLDGTALGLIL